MALYRYFKVLVFVEHFGKFRQSTGAVGLHFPGAACKHEAVVQRDINLAVAHRYGEAPVFEAQKGVGKALAQVGSCAVFAAN